MTPKKDLECPVCQNEYFEEEAEDTLRCKDCLAVISLSGELLEVS